MKNHSKFGFKQIIFEANFPTPLPSKFVREYYGNDLNQKFPSSFFRDGNEWFLFIEKFRNLSIQEIERIVDMIVEEYDKYFPDINAQRFIKIDGKFIRRGLSEMANSFFNEMASTPGTIILPMALIGFDSMIFSIIYHESNALKVTENVTNLMENTPYHIDIEVRGTDINNFEPFTRFLKRSMIPQDNFMLVKTQWLIDSDIIKSENDGIFQNSALFYPKFFDHTDMDSQMHLILELDSEEFFGNQENVTWLDRENKIAEVKISSYWATDVIRYVLLKLGSGFIYKGKSKGNLMDNYFIMESRNLNIFLRGLREYLNDQKRIFHKNVIDYIINYDDFIQM
jgi:hypothetical protein